MHLNISAVWICMCTLRFFKVGVFETLRQHIWTGWTVRVIWRLD